MDPREVWLSPHFLLSDFLGNHTAYSQGFPNAVNPRDRELPIKIKNGRALCVELLEPILAELGPMSIGYGIITPALSRAIVRYQDPGLPSHHLWNLGAAADICVHRWVNDDPDRDDQQNSPFNLALFGIHSRLALPFSRLIAYSESPYLCIAASASEIEEGRPRLALYENRYEGIPRAKPDYRKYASAAAKKRECLDRLFADPLAHGWRGDGYPTYHGGGRRQYQHVRVSKYTMLSDWLFDWKLISEGHSNIPERTARAMDLFYACGDIYDAMLDGLDIPRLPIIQGYVGFSNSAAASGRPWFQNEAYFTVAVPEYVDIQQAEIAAMVCSDDHAHTEGRKITFTVER